MDKLVNFEWYKDTFKGTNINDVDIFNKYYLQAVNHYYNYTLKPKKMTEDLMKDEDSAYTIKLTLCEMIDNLFYGDELIELAKRNDKINALGISSESVKDHNVKFTTSKQLNSSKIKSDTETNNIIVMNKYLTRLGLLYRGLC